MSITIKIDTRKLDKLLRDLPKLNTVAVKFGWFGSARYPIGTRAKGLKPAQVAYWQEYGTYGGNHIPPRPFFSLSNANFAQSVIPHVKDYFIANLTRTVGKQKSIQAIKDLAVKNFKDTVDSGRLKHLSKKTIELKGDDKMWDETGFLLDNFKASITRK